jgi:hypothetical protein
MEAGPELEPAHGWLTSPEAVPVLTAAAEFISTRSPLAAASAFAQAFPALPADRRAAALGAATLDVAARAKGYPSGLLWTRTGLEQSTGPLTATRRAQLLAGAGIASIIDISAGLGMDARAMLEAGISVTAVESDPTTAAYLAHNLATITTSTGDSHHNVRNANSVDPEVLAELHSLGSDAWFVDPARRSSSHDGNRSRPERDPELWSPPWSFVENLRTAVQPARVAAKVAPGFSPAAHWHAEWISIDRTVVECALYSWPVFASQRQCAVWRDGWHVVEKNFVEKSDVNAEELNNLEPGPIDSLLLEVDPAVIRCGALMDLAHEIPGAHLIDHKSSWLTAQHLDRTMRMQAFVRAYRVIDEVPSTPRKLREVLRARGIKAVALKTGEVNIDATAVRKELRVKDDDENAVVFTNAGSGTRAFLVERIR